MSFANIILGPEIVKGKQPPFMAFLFSSGHEELQDKEWPQARLASSSPLLAINLLNLFSSFFSRNT